MVSDYIVAQIRTYVPIGAGALITWLFSLGIDVGAEAKVGLVTFGTALVTGAYYTLASAIQRKWPRIGGILLGSKKVPTYVSPELRGGDAGTSASIRPTGDNL